MRVEVVDISQQGFANLVSHVLGLAVLMPILRSFSKLLLLNSA